MNRRGAAILLVTALALAPATGTAQVISGEVRSELRRTPVEGALIRSVRWGARTVTGASGRFELRLPGLPDTLVVRAMGFRETRVALSRDGRVTIGLEDVPIPLPAVVASAQSFALARSGNVDWTLSSDLLAEIPFGVEPDPIRSLRLIPSVTFTTPLSGRPIVRGYDAWESAVRIDGFEVVNPYHLGRIFSALPPGLRSDVEVTLAPGDVTVGETNAASIDIVTLPGAGEQVHGGGALSLVSGSSWVTGGAGPVRWAGAARIAHLDALLSNTVVEFPYTFGDGYVTATAPLLGGWGRLVGFGSRDRLVNAETGEGMQWGNVLVGAELARLIGRRMNLRLRSSASRFTQDVFEGPFRTEVIDVENRFQRLAAEGEIEARVAGATVKLGAGIESRDVRNLITSVEETAGPPRFDRNARIDVPQTHAFAGVVRAFGPIGVHAGIRLDDGPGEAILQPRLRLTFQGGENWYGQIAVGRTGRHVHALAERIPEPNLLFVDFWLPAGTNGVPVAEIDHSSADAAVSLGEALAARVSVFGSRGSGLGELTPFWVATDAPFRFGESRTFGIESHVALGDPDGRRSLSVIYVLSRSDREWGDGWVPWSFDQRHRVRVHGVLTLGGVRLFALGEAASGAPITPPTQRVPLPDVDVPGGGLTRDETVNATLLFGDENSVTGPGTAFLDLGASFSFHGPWSSDWTLGVSVLNVTFGNVAPAQPFLGGGQLIDVPFPREVGDTVDVRFGRLFDMPAIPSLMLSVRF